MKKCLLSASILTALIGLPLAQPAAAITFDNSKSFFTIDTNADVGESIDVFFNGIVEGKEIPGLTSEARFTVESIVNNAITLSVALSNTSSTPITGSRVSVLGLNIDSEGTAPTATSTGVFTKVATNGNIPQANTIPQLEKIGEFCFTIGNCAGGANGGVNFGNSDSFSPVFTFDTLPQFVTFNNFFVRYQSLESDTTIALGSSSGVGVGEVPTPALLPGLVGMGVAALRKQRKSEEVEQDA